MARKNLLSARTITSLAVIGALTFGATPTSAFAVREKPLDRRAAIKRAKVWAKKRVKYSQVRHAAGYRRDCSGFVSYAWDLPENLTTWRIPLVAKRISKRNLKPGDVLLDAKSGRGRHVVIFEKWANKKRTRYWAIEQTGQRGVDRAIRRVVPYPYRVNKRNYKPYRYVGMSKYYRVMKRRDLQPVSGYSGRVETLAEEQQRERLAANSKKRERERKVVQARNERRARRWAANQVAKARAAANRRTPSPVQIVATQLAKRHKRNTVILEYVIDKAVIKPVREVIRPDTAPRDAGAPARGGAADMAAVADRESSWRSASD